MKSNRSIQRGFTLIEVMVVVVILGILAAIVVPKVMDRPDQARITKAHTDIAAIESALNLYKLDNYNYPNTSEGLEALVTAYPDLRSSVFTASGEINKFLRVFLGERDTADLNGRETPVSDGDELSLVTPIAGG